MKTRKVSNFTLRGFRLSRSRLSPSIGRRVPILSDSTLDRQIRCHPNVLNLHIEMGFRGVDPLGRGDLRLYIEGHIEA